VIEFVWKFLGITLYLGIIPHIGDFSTLVILICYFVEPEIFAYQLRSSSGVS
jgi:hypothetical protein